MGNKFERHLIQPKQVELVNEMGEKDVFLLEPLPFSHLGDMFDSLKGISKLADIDENASEKEQTKQILEGLDKPTVDVVKKLVLSTLIASYPDEDKVILEKFAGQHFMELFPIVIEINTKTMAGNANDQGKVPEVKR